MKFAICQELFVDWSWERQCQFVAETGYTGIEVAPFTLGAAPRDIDPVTRRTLRQTAADHGLEIIGLHWLLARTAGLHLTTPEAAVRRATADYLADLGDLCADLGGRIMVFGSPQQRNKPPGVTASQALEYAVDVFRACLPRIAARDVTICFEPLTTKETDFVTTCAAAAELICRVDHPHCALHQDVKAMLGEPTPIPELIAQFKGLTRHFHVNDSNLLGPGMGETDFRPILRALLDSGYDGWVSLEVFDYAPGAERIARESLQYLQRVLAEVAP